MQCVFFARHSSLSCRFSCRRYIGGRFNSLWPEQHDLYSANILNYIFTKKDVCILIQISLKWFLKDTVISKSPFIQIMTGHLTENKPLSKPMFMKIFDAIRCHHATMLPSSLSYKPHLSRQSNCRSLRCSYSIACRRYSNYIFILDLTPGFIGLGKGNSKTRRETIKFGDLVRLILEILRYCKFESILDQVMAWCQSEFCPVKGWNFVWHIMSCWLCMAS